MLIMINNQLCNSESSLSCIAMNQGSPETCPQRSFPPVCPDIETSASDSHMENYHHHHSSDTDTHYSSSQDNMVIIIDIITEIIVIVRCCRLLLKS